MDQIPDPMASEPKISHILAARPEDSVTRRARSSATNEEKMATRIENATSCGL
jgi:hypothetical protein